MTLLSSSLLLAVTLAAAPTGSTVVPPGVETPALRFDKELGLMDAVRLTLQHDPNIKLRDVDVAAKEGVVREMAGQFDTTLSTEAAFQYHREELRESVKEREQVYRDNLDKAIPRVEALRNAYRVALTNLNDPRVTSDPKAVDLAKGITDPDVSNEMALLQAQFVLINDLIGQTANAVVRQDFITLRQQTFDRSLQRFTALFKEIENQPEQLRKLRQDLGATPIDQWARNGSLHAELARQLRSGILVSPFVDVTYDAANYVGKDSWDPAKGGLGVKPVYKGQIGFDVVLPLLRGRGAADVAASERAAAVDVEASRLLTLQQQSESVLQTVLAYWELRSALDQVAVLKRSVQLQADLLSLTRQLIKAKDSPRSDEARILASNADAQARLESTERRVAEARVALARVMGIALADPALAPLPADAFPRPPDTWGAAEDAIGPFASQAASHRYDYQAVVKLSEAGRVLVRGAELESRRRLDLDTKLWGTSIGEESPKFGSWVFRSVRAALELEMPLKNDQRLGVLAQQRASLQQSTIDATDLKRTTALNVTRLARSLRLSAERLARAEEAVTHYDRTIEDERAKLRAGDSTLVDMILTEQQTTAARLSRVSAQQDYADTLAQLRFEAGLLVGDGKVTEDALFTAPAPIGAARN